MKVAAVVLTFNEELHLARCIESIREVVDEIVIVDCYSTDATLEIARTFGAIVLQNSWVNHATQFNWALQKLDPETDWVLRIDADEVLAKDLAKSIKERLPQLPPSVNGVYLRRRMAFQGRLIRHGGIFPVEVLRLFRYGTGQSEIRWMDEHITVSGGCVVFPGELIDDNLNSLTWWTDKHNRYASLEAVELLNLEFHFMSRESGLESNGSSQASLKRWIKERIYARLPSGVRALAYFLYRYVLRGGFLDGKEGAAFHFLQAYWYRFLVDAKIFEVKRYMASRNVDVVTAIRQVLGVKV